jgi:hypothetical protein
MSKREKNKLITKTFLTWVTANYPEYEIFDGDNDGSFMLVNKKYPNDLMSYYRLYHGVCTYSYSPAEMLEHEAVFNNYIQTIIIPEVNWLLKIS